MSNSADLMSICTLGMDLDPDDAFVEEVLAGGKPSQQKRSSSTEHPAGTKKAFLVEDVDETRGDQVRLPVTPSANQRSTSTPFPSSPASPARAKTLSPTAKRGPGRPRKSTSKPAPLIFPLTKFEDAIEILSVRFCLSRVEAVFDQMKSDHLKVEYWNYTNAADVKTGLLLLMKAILARGSVYIERVPGMKDAFWDPHWQYHFEHVHAKDDRKAWTEWKKLEEKFQNNWSAFYDFCAMHENDELIDDTTRKGSSEDFTEALQDAQRTSQQVRTDALLRLSKRMDAEQASEDRLNEMVAIQHEQLQLHREEIANFKHTSETLAALVICVQQIAQFFQPGASSSPDPKDKEPEE